MNDERRARIRSVIAKLEAINTEIEDILSDEQDAFDNMPEGFQQSERGDHVKAEKLYAKGQYWLDRSNKLRGNS